MSLYKRGQVWWLRFTAPNGKWRRVYDTNGAQIASITVDAYVPAGTTVGVFKGTISRK